MSRRATWPDTLSDIADVIGEELALELARAEGGLDRVYIPRQPTAEHPWARVIGEEAWTRLVDAYAGQRLSLPRGCFLRLKKVEVLELAEEGLSHREIARRVRVTERYVRRLLAQSSTVIDPRQGSLPF